MARKRGPRLHLGEVLAVPVSVAPVARPGAADDAVAEPLGVSLVPLVGFTTWEGAAYPWSIGSASYYAAVWPGIFDADVGIEGFDSDAAAVAALFLSAPGWRYPRWQKVGNAPMPPDLPFPAYRSTTPDGPIVVDFTYVHRRSVEQADVRDLRPATWGTSGLLEDLIAVVNGLRGDDLKSLEHWAIVDPPNRTAAWFPDHPGLQHRPPPKRQRPSPGPAPRVWLSDLRRTMAPMNIDDRGQLLVWIVLAEQAPREPPEISVHWHESLATAAADRPARPGRGIEIRRIPIEGNPPFEGGLDTRPRCVDCREPIELNDPADPISWIHTEDANDWGDHTANHPPAENRHRPEVPR